jgi:S1-C subfamily serine protease
MMARQRFVRGSFASLVVSVMAVACGDKQAPPQTPSANTAAPKPATATREVHERIVPHVCPARRKLAQLLGSNNTPGLTPEQSAESAPPPSSSAGDAVRVAANQAYRAVAPSTVLIRTGSGMGTGVVIDPRGYVLTNNHVIADGRKQNFVISANVTFGDLTPTGRMLKQDQNYEAVVVKVDPIRDLAIVKIKDPPAKLTAVKLAKTAPQIAEKVISVGHAGIGFLWAAKTCNVASVGERQYDVSRLAAFDCSNTDPSLTEAEAKRSKERCDESKKAMTDALNATTQGLAVQTDCAITHGDSGGPLVNAVGELVGLNQSISADLATASFHVHVDEIREFTSNFPEEGVAILPDPFCDGGSNTSLEDIDLDGIPDTVVSKGSSNTFAGYDRFSLLVDLDQNHFTKPEMSDTFDGEIALLTIRDTTYVWYDTDNDSRFDLVLIDKDNDGAPEQAFRLDKDGKPTEDKAAVPHHDLSSRYVKNTALHARLGKIATAIGGTKYVNPRVLAASKELTRTPDPILGGGAQGRAVDSDRNGNADAAVMRGAFSRGLLIDADEDSLRSVKPGEPVDELVKAKKVDAEISFVVQGSAVWAMYDTDNDSKFDLALMTTNGTDTSSLLATNAWRLGAGGEMTPAPEQLGRKLLRPGLLPSMPRVVTALRLLGSDVAMDEGLGSLPSPRLSSRARFHVVDVAGFAPGTVVQAQYGGSSAMLFDVDHDTKLPKPVKPAGKDTAKAGIDEAELTKMVDEGKFDAEVALVHRYGSDGGSDYVFYDTDSDGKFDLVLFVATSGKNPTQAYRTKSEDKLEVDPSAITGKMIRHRNVFKDKAMGPKWKAIAAKTLRAASIEE